MICILSIFYLEGAKAMPRKFLKEKHLGFHKIAQSRFIAHMPKYQLWEIRLPRYFGKLDLAQEIRFYHRAAYFFHLQRQDCVAALKLNQDDPRLLSNLKVYRVLNAQGNRLKDVLLVKAVELGIASIVGQYEARGKQYVRYRIGEQDYVSLLSVTGWKNLPKCEPLSAGAKPTLGDDERQSILHEFADVGRQHYATIRIRSLNTKFTQILARINHCVNEHRKVYPLIKKKIEAGEIILIEPDREEIPYCASIASQIAAQRSSQLSVLHRFTQRVNQFWSDAGKVAARIARFKA